MTRQEAPRYPWISIITEGSAQAEARQKWRTALNTIIDVMHRDRQKAEGIHLRNIQSIIAVSRALTIQDPGRVGNQEVSSKGQWSDVDQEDGIAFKNSTCLASDRMEFLQWLGRFVGGVNWQASRRGSAPIAVSVACALISVWATIGWGDKETPDWCQEFRDKTSQRVFNDSRKDTYRPWSEARSDMHAFLDGWRNERIALGRRAPRKSSGGLNNSGAVMGMHQQLLILRSLAVGFPGSIEAEDTVILKAIGGVLQTNSSEHEIETVLQVLEDRTYLELGLEKIDSDVPKIPGRARKI